MQYPTIHFKSLTSHRPRLTSALNPKDLQKMTSENESMPQAHKHAGYPATPGAIYARGWNDAIRAAAKTARFHSIEEPAFSIAGIIAVNIEKLDISSQGTP